MILPALVEPADEPDRRRGPSLQPPPDHPRRRHDRAEAAEEREGAVRGRRRPGQPRPDVPRRGRRRHARHRRVRHRRREQPAAPDHPRAERHRPLEGRERPRQRPGDQPLRDRATCTSERLDSENVMELFAQYDLIVDGTDNFATRYLVNDACVLLGKPYVWGSIYRFDGQASVFWAEHGPCYRCLYPEPPPPGMVPVVRRGRRARRAVRLDRLDPGDRGDQAADGHRRLAARPARWSTTRSR